VGGKHGGDLGSFGGDFKGFRFACGDAGVVAG
jgi:hypothetical protein